MSQINIPSNVSVPGEPAPTASPLIRNLTIVASALTAASIAINLMLQVAHFFKKRPMEPDQRDRLQAAGLTLTILRHLPALVKQVRLLIDQAKHL
jgi:hypothetical protein